MPINVTSVYTKERLLKLSNYMVRRKKVFWSVMAVCTTFILSVYCLFNFVWAITDSSINLCTYLILVWDVIYIYFYLIHPKFSIKKAKNLNAEIKFTFDEEFFKTEVSSSEIEEIATSKYSVIKKIVKNGSDIYLVVSRTQAIIVDTSALPEEELAQLKKLLQSKIPEKKFKWK